MVLDMKYRSTLPPALRRATPPPPPPHPNWKPGQPPPPPGASWWVGSCLDVKHSMLRKPPKREVWKWWILYFPTGYFGVGVSMEDKHIRYDGITMCHLTPDSRWDSWYSIGQANIPSCVFVRMCVCGVFPDPSGSTIWLNIKIWRNSIYFNIFQYFISMTIFACRMLSSSISCLWTWPYIHFISPSGPGPPQKPGGTLEA